MGVLAWSRASGRIPSILMMTTCAIPTCGADVGAGGRVAVGRLVAVGAGDDVKVGGCVAMAVAVGGSVVVGAGVAVEVGDREAVGVGVSVAECAGVEVGSATPT
jgi:hypothetical protein